MYVCWAQAITTFTKKKCLYIFLGISNTFDTVLIPLLLFKLGTMNIRGKYIYKKYPSKRIQVVKIGSNVSDDNQLSIGVQQGNILGLTFIITYINDLYQLWFPNCRVITYADNITLLIHMEWIECTWWEWFYFSNDMAIKKLIPAKLYLSFRYTSQIKYPSVSLLTKPSAGDITKILIDSLCSNTYS